MSVRFKNAIENSIVLIELQKKQIVDSAREEAIRLRDKINEYKDDIVDAIDTYNFICEKELANKMNNGKFGAIFFKDNSICYKAIDDYLISVDKENINVSRLSKKSTLNNMIKDVRIKEKPYEKGNFFAVLPIYDNSGYYTIDDAKNVLTILNDFSNLLKQTLDTFFNDVQNLCINKC